MLLCDYNAKHAHFRVMPRYKIKAEGEVVGREGGKGLGRSGREGGGEEGIEKGKW